MASPYTSRLESNSLSNPMGGFDISNGNVNWGQSTQPQQQPLPAKVNNPAAGMATVPQTHSNVVYAKSQEEEFLKMNGSKAQMIQRLVDDGMDPIKAAQQVMAEYPEPGATEEDLQASQAYKETGGEPQPEPAKPVNGKGILEESTPEAKAVISQDVPNWASSEEDPDNKPAPNITMTSKEGIVLNEDPDVDPSVDENVPAETRKLFQVSPEGEAMLKGLREQKAAKAAQDKADGKESWFEKVTGAVGEYFSKPPEGGMVSAAQWNQFKTDRKENIGVNKAMELIGGDEYAEGSRPITVADPETSMTVAENPAQVAVAPAKKVVSKIVTDEKGEKKVVQEAVDEKKAVAVEEGALATDTPEEAEKVPEGSALSRFLSSGKVESGLSSLSKGLIDYAISYGTTRDSGKALAAGIGGVSGKMKVNKRKLSTGELTNAGLNSAQIDQYVQTGQLSASSEAQLAIKIRSDEDLKLEAAKGKSKSGKGGFNAVEGKAFISTADQAQFYSELERFDKSYGRTLDQVLVDEDGWGLKRAIEDMFLNSTDNDVVTHMGKRLVGSDLKAAYALSNTFIEGILRLNSGAALNKDEVVKYMDRYFPKPGEKDPIVQQKRRARASVNATMKAMGGEFNKAEALATRDILASGDYLRAVRYNGGVGYTQMIDGVEKVVYVYNEE